MLRVPARTTDIKIEDEVTANITNHAGTKDEADLPKNRIKDHQNKDVYFDDKDKAIKFCDDAKKLNPLDDGSSVTDTPPRQPNKRPAGGSSYQCILFCLISLQ